MIKLPPGCSVAYGIRIDVDKLSTDMVEWFKTIDGHVIDKAYYGIRGNEVKSHQVSYGGGKYSHTETGSGITRIHFLGKDASVASMFLLKFSEHVTFHNLKEINETHY